MDWQAAFAFWEWSTSLMGRFHMYWALAAVLLGPAVLMRRKGDFTHRLLGLFYIFAMLATNSTALVLYDFTGGPNIFHFFAVFSLITILCGLIGIMIYAATKGPIALTTHIECMSWSYFGLLMALGAEVFTRGLGPQIDSYRTFWIFFSGYMLVASVIGSVVTFKLVKDVKQRWLGPTGKQQRAA